MGLSKLHSFHFFTDSLYISSKNYLQLSTVIAGIKRVPAVHVINYIAKFLTERWSLTIGMLCLFLLCHPMETLELPFYQLDHYRAI